MKRKAIPPFVMTAGQSGRLLFDFSLPEGAARPVLRGALMVHGERVDMAAGDGELTIPALPAGVYLAEVRAGGVCVLYGHVEVLPSPLYADAGEARYEVAVDARADVLEVNVVLRDGPRGMSAYEIARQEGFEGTEAEWLEYLRVQNATLAVQQVTPLMERAESAATNAAANEEASSIYAAEAQRKAETATVNASAAQTAASNAAQSASEAKASASAALSDREAANAFMRQAGSHADSAEASAEVADQKAKAAEASASDAFGSASQAKASETAAATAATNAETSANSAAKSATEAAQSAELLGDAALQSGDNTFTGNNVFSGETWGVLPIDFYKFSWCKTYADMKIICPTWAGLKNVCVDLSNLDEPEYYGVMDPDADILENVFFYFSGDIKRVGTLSGRQPSTSKNPLKSFTVYAPNATKCGRFRLPPNVEEVKIITPNTVFHTSCFDWAVNLKRIYFITKNTRLARTKKGMFAAGWPYEYVQEIHAPLNILTSVELPDFFALHTIGYGFPSATIINLQKASLNKSSVMAILNALLTYDAETMTAIPELTLGIDPTLDGDAEINEALLLAQTAVEDGGKGWNVAVSGFTITAGGGTTMALRKPVFAKHWQDADGSYIDAEGVRYAIRYGNTVLENWVANEQLGYEEFGSIEDALNEWGLTEVEDLTEEGE